MENRILVLLFASQVPLFTALVGAIIEAISLQDSVTVREKHVKQLLVCYFAAFFFIGSGVATELALPALFVWLWPLTVFSLYIAPVLYYRFVMVLTDTSRKKPAHFSGHYLLPALAAAACALLREESIGDLSLSGLLFIIISVVQFIFTLLYMTLACRRLHTCYRQNREKVGQWAQWFRLSRALCVLSLVWSGAFFLTIWRDTALWALPLAVVAAWAQAVLLCCDSFNSRSLLFLPLSLAPVLLKTPDDEPAGNHVEEEAPLPLTRNTFERRVVVGKLFLNSQLRLTDLMKLFHTNRTYLSAFINREYGYGFNGYINRLRLAELERLMTLPSNRGKSASKLYGRAGFPTYQVYLRIKREVKGENGPDGNTGARDADTKDTNAKETDL